jgi:hypothetical protein
MTERPTGAESPSRPLALIALAITGVLTGACLGALTNAINGWVSPRYFVTILRWHGVEDVWRASVAQGVLEGLLFGTCFSLLFVTGVGIATRAGCTYGFAVRYLIWIACGALVCWVLGGLAAMGLATLSPEFYRAAFIGVPEELGEMLAYAWVGGSITGMQLGGLACVFLGVLLLRADWQRETSPLPHAGPQGPTATVESKAR